jgi:transcriptional regulator with XRE-family HTH domain
MPGEAAGNAESSPVLRTLADKVNWLIEQAHPAGRGPFTNNEVADLIKKTTGEEISYTQIWKLRNGQAQNPQMRLIEAMAKTFGVPAAFFFPEFDEKQAGLLLRTILTLSPQARKAITDLIAVTVGDDARRQAARDEAD